MKNFSMDKYNEPLQTQANEMMEGAGDFMNYGQLDNGLNKLMDALAVIGGRKENAGAGLQNTSSNMASNNTKPIAANNFMREESNQLADIESSEVLFEACTMGQSQNASLRKAHSLGTYYFLKGKNI